MTAGIAFRFPAGLVAALLAGAVMAQDVPGQREAAAALFPHRAEAFEIRFYRGAGITDEQRVLLQRVAESQPYYAAFAIAPDVGLMAEPSTAAANQHNLEAARRDALAACDAKRQGGTPCVVVLEVTPRGWEPRDFQLNRAATEAFTGPYRSLAAPKAFAISDTTAEWGYGQGATAAAAREAAIAACAARPAAPRDCVVVSAD